MSNIVKNDVNKLVTSLDLSKKLKEAGVPQGDSAFMWLKNNRSDQGENGWRVVKRTDRMEKYSFPDAFLLAEILDMSCSNTKIWKAEKLEGAGQQYVAVHDGEQKLAKTGADAAAQLLLHLIETGHIDFD